MTDAGQASTLSVTLEWASAVFGIAGTYLMSRRYTTSFIGFLGLAVVAPLLFLVGRGEKVRAYYGARTEANRDVPIAMTRMALGLGLLCWAFFFQLVNLLLA